MSTIPCRLGYVLVDEANDSQTVYLQERDGERRLPIVIGPMEAAAIDRAVKGQGFARPLTHDLLTGLIDLLGASIEEVAVVREEQGTYFAELVLRQQNDERLRVDCRPSDAIALYTRLPGCRLTVAEDLLEHA